MANSCTSDTKTPLCDMNTGTCTGCKVNGTNGNNENPEKGTCADGQTCCNEGHCIAMGGNSQKTSSLFHLL